MTETTCIMYGYMFCEYDDSVVCLYVCVYVPLVDVSDCDSLCDCILQRADETGLRTQPAESQCLETVHTLLGT